MRSDARTHRKVLIAAAARIFERDGYEVPLQVVLDETGLGRGTLYRHFRDRISLIVAVMEHQHHELTDFVDANLESPDLLVTFIRRQGWLSVMILPALRKLDQQHVLELIGPLIARAELLNERVAEQARRSGIVARAFSGKDLSLVNRMLMNVTDEDEPRNGAQFARALEIVLAGIAE